MSLMVMVNAGKLKIIANAINAPSATSEDFQLGLFSNNVTIVDATTFAALTEAAFTGYARVSLPRADWLAAVLVGNVATITTSVDPTFTNTGGTTETEFGWFIVGATSGVMYFGANFSPGIPMIPGAVLQLDPFTFSSDTFTA